MGKVIVVGSLNMDLIINTAVIPAMGETVIGDSFMTAPGGKGANQAVAVAKLGEQVSILGCVGNDVFGIELIENLEKNYVDTENIKILDGISTGIAVIVVKDGNNFIIVEPGANHKLTPLMVEKKEDIIKGSSFMIVQLEVPLKTVETAISIAKRHGVEVVLNPSPFMPLSDEFLSKVDILILNETESQLLTGMRINSIEDAKKIISYIRKKGVRQVIVTLGGQGASYNKGDSILHIPVPDVEVVDTTGAGDAFAGAVVVALSQGKGIDEAIYYANMVGTITVMKKGAQPSLPNQLEVEEFIRKFQL
jgi:ribokinase